MKHDSKHNLVEVAWEVCNQVGGIYTVIRTKIPAISEKWGDRYCLVGPYIHKNVSAEFEPVEDFSDDFGQSVLKMREMGFEVHYGRWLVTGKPKVVLLNPYSVYTDLGKIKYLLWEHHSIEFATYDPLIDQVLAFGYLAKMFFTCLAEVQGDNSRFTVAHFHEWMAATPIPAMRRENLQTKIVFTTHATILGRYLAMNDGEFYTHLPYYNWAVEAKNFNIEAQVKIERAAAHGAHVLTTVSDVTALECEYLLGRKCDQVLPNGLNIERFVALHEFQNLHKTYKDKIHQFVMGHFFHSYSFDLENTLYFFTSGRFEYRNKGFDLTLEALARLNWRMKQEKIDTTIVMFIVTKQPYHSINPRVLESRAVMEEIRENVDAITKQIGNRLFYASAASSDSRLPQLNEFVDEYWKLRLRRTIQSWKSKELPLVVTHNLIHDGSDPVLGFLRTSNLINNAHDPVKVVYHPDFIAPTNPLFGMEYGQFVRGCHLGVFPSYYEPWGYTPLECMASGVPAVTSDLSGFGDYVLKTMPDAEENGVYVVRRRDRNYHQAADQLADQMMNFVRLNRRERITLRNKVERTSDSFDWNYLTAYYDKAYDLALAR